ncbi:RsmB/NOP family class I SAM-dependent RNA methyltransferase [Deferribacter thermophilus]|uniref:RsmB/NOP family class I SAM-dependent RNA methyltransferase n=1 Tax=Deferribacter thermophilus TaxID=53573 RepID=UPI003C2332BF
MIYLDKISELLKKIYHEKLVARIAVDKFIRNLNVNSKQRKEILDFIYDCIRFLGFVKNHDFKITKEQLDELKNNLILNKSSFVNILGFNEEISKLILDSIPIDDFSLFLERAPLTIRANMIKTTREKLLIEFENKFKKYKTVMTQYSPYGLTVDSHINVRVMEKFKKGFFEIQDEASQLITFLLPIKPGNSILDICAGTGGKSLAIASHFYNSVNIEAFDIDKNRLQKLAKRSKIADAKIKIINKTKTNFYDAVLIDAPCSGLGTLRRDVDLNIRTTPRSLKKVLNLQRTIFNKAAESAKTGGYIIYVTCSFLKEENEKQVEYFLENHKNIKLINLSDILTDKQYNIFIHNQFFKTSPKINGMDSFFGAVFQKTH